MIARTWHGVVPAEKAEAYLLLLTLWDSLDAIRAFAGPDMERAKYYPEDEAFLLELEPTVTHYEVLASPECDSNLPGKPRDSSE
jgi:hypothetical protein